VLLAQAKNKWNKVINSVKFLFGGMLPFMLRKWRSVQCYFLFTFCKFHVFRENNKIFVNHKNKFVRCRENKKSKYKTDGSSSGVPQDSSLGPFLFLFPIRCLARHEGNKHDCERATSHKLVRSALIPSCIAITSLNPLLGIFYFVDLVCKSSFYLFRNYLNGFLMAWKENFIFFI
jgi:hypothetical protein